MTLTKRMRKNPTATLRLTLDVEALRGNWLALSKLSEAAVAGAAVKANCYGLGVERCVPTLRDAGCEMFFIAHWSELEHVAKYVSPSHVSVLHGPLNEEEAQFCLSSGAVPVINSVRQAIIWKEVGGGLCHLMVDTGMNRLGLSPNDISNTAIQELDVDILMSHLACSDEDNSMNSRQRMSFSDLLGSVKYRRASLANSGGIMLGQDYHFDVTRPGLAIFGGTPRRELANHIRQVARPEAVVIQTRFLMQGDTVGYNASFKAETDMKVATVSIGYADGFLRSRGFGQKSLMFGGQHLPIIGKISMDMLVVDISSVPYVTEGDWLEVPFNLFEEANASGLSQYELLTSLGNRFTII